MSSARKRRKVKKAAGIACCRMRNDVPELIMVQKRFTYAFNSFVMGAYNTTRDLLDLFNCMTTNEKLDILSANFDILWYRLWLEIPSEHPNRTYDFSTSIESIENTISILKPPTIAVNRYEVYKEKKAKYDKCKSAEHLPSLMINTKNVDLPWSIPKGRYEKGETSLTCAGREFHEETGIHCNSIRFVRDIKPINDVYYVKGTKYVHDYYVAEDISCVVDNIFIPSRSYEIAQIKWISADNLALLSCDNVYSAAERILSLYGKN
jgi:ADP-ribose pyrophosphatase YjhB (NUDIX family)